MAPVCQALWRNHENPADSCCHHCCGCFCFLYGGTTSFAGSGPAGRVRPDGHRFPVPRPAFTFVPAADMRLQGLGNRTLRPKTRHSVDGDARIWFAVYGNGTGTLVTAVADTEGTWEWEAAHHPAFPAIRAQQYAYKGETLYESLMQLDGDSDPFCTDHAACLAYQGKAAAELPQDPGHHGIS